MNFSTQQRGKQMAAAMAVAIIIGLVFFLPSGVLNLRLQEGIFPVVAVGYVLAMAMMAYAGIASGLFLLVVMVLALTNFTPSAWEIVRYAIIMAGFWFLVVSMRKDLLPLKSWAYNAVCGVALLNVLWLILQRAGVFLFFYPRFGGDVLATGFFANQNEVSCFLAMALPCFFRPFWKWMIPAVVVGLALASSAVGLVSAAVVGCVMAVQYAGRRLTKGQVAAVGLAALLVGGALVEMIHPVLGEKSTSQRAAAWSRALPLLNHHGIFGWGMGQGKYILPLYLNAREVPKESAAAMYSRVIYKEDLTRLFAENLPKEDNEIKAAWTYLHNDLLQWWIEAGLVGMLALGILIFGHGLAFLRTPGRDWIPALGIAAALCTACFFFTFQIGRLLFLAVLYAAFLQAQYLMEASRGQDA